MHLQRGRNVSTTFRIRILSSFLALGVALILPALRTHNFGQLYRPIEIRQAAARHSFLDFEDCRGDVQVEPVSLNPLPTLLPIKYVGTLGLHKLPVLTAPVPVPRFVVRHLRLGGARSSPPDPLLA